MFWVNLTAEISKLWKLCKLCAFSVSHIPIRTTIPIHAKRLRSVIHAALNHWFMIHKIQTTTEDVH